MRKSESRRRRYLIIPSMPTPNGRLHLGHIAGPYLRADLLRRHLRRMGHDCRMISGLDAYESYVARRSHEERTTPPEIVGRYAGEIAADLAAIRIEPDTWVNPLADEWKDEFASFQRGIMSTLVARDRAVARRERLLRSIPSRRFVVGCWLVGECPNCGAESGSFSCERCGAHYQPTELVAPRDLLNEPVAWHDVSSQFLNSFPRQRVQRGILSAEIETPTRDLAFAHASRRGLAVRLTLPFDWGIPWEETARCPSVLFSYTFNYAYALFCGRILQRQLGATVSPFDVRSDISTIAVMGIDVAISKIVNATTLAAILGTKPYDRYSVNRFYLLEGRKFSTSRRHAIWCEPVIRSGASRDALRYYLAKSSPTSEETDFRPEQCVAETNRALVNRWNHLALRHDGPLQGCRVGARPSELARNLDELVADQREALEREPLDPGRAVRDIDAWLERALQQGKPSGNWSYWWLKGLAFLSSPVMPDFSDSLWRRLGEQTEPDIERLGIPSRPEPGRLPRLPRLSLRHFQAGRAKQ